jgi:hypothetical protein
MSISSHHVIRIESTLKGPAKPNETMVVVIPGGRFEFEDGSWALLKTPGFNRPMTKLKYVWFLRPAGNEGQGHMFVPAHGPLGIYELTAEGKEVRASGWFDTDFARFVAQSRMTPPVFLEAIAEALKPR